MKVKKNITIEKEIWDRARAMGLNISGECEKALRTMTQSNHELLCCIKYCKLCKKEELKIEKQYKITHDDYPNPSLKNEDGKTLITSWFVCEDCLRNISKDKFLKTYDKETFRICKRVYGIMDDQLKSNRSPETIAKVEAGLIRLYKQFETEVGVYDGNVIGDEDLISNDIKTLIKQISDEPLLNWKWIPGEISVPCDDIWGEGWENQ